MNRKQFLASAAASMILGSSCNQPKKYSGKRLVIIRLMGGMDGYHFIAPKNNDAFKTQRPFLYQRLNSEGIYHENDWLIHPQFGGLFDLIQYGNLNIIPHVGFEDYISYSHFTAERYWETGELIKYEEGRSELNIPTGWIGRLGDENKLKGISPKINPVITLDNYSSLFDHGNHFQGLIFEGIDPKQNYIPLLENWLQQNSDKKNYVTRLIENQFNQLAYTMQLENQMVDRKDFLGKIRQVEEILEKDLPFKVIHLSQDGYDTHANQKQRIEPLFKDVVDGLKSLNKYLKESGKQEETLVFVYSEFGRSIETNDSGGTDHGKANLAFILGGHKTVSSFKYPLTNIETFQVGRHHYVKHQINYQDIQLRITDWLIDV